MSERAGHLSGEPAHRDRTNRRQRCASVAQIAAPLIVRRSTGASYGRVSAR